MTQQENPFQKAINQGHSAAWDQEWDRAASYYRQALNIKPGDTKALNSLALALYELRDYQEALQFYLQVAKKTPTDPVPLEKIATLYEILDQPNIGAEAAVRAAETYLKAEDVDKAIENWSRAVGMNPEHVVAHSRLAIVYERLRRVPQAVREYLHIASLMQNSGDKNKATQAINRALKIAPNNEEARQALVMLRDEVPLPKPARPQGGTGPIVEQPESLPETTQEEADSDSDPIEEAQGKALSVLATLFFEQSSEEAEKKTERRGLRSIVDGTGPLFDKNIDKTKLMLHLGQAVESLTHGDKNRAAEELKRVTDIGLHHPAAYFSLGYLWVENNRLESAIRHLKRSAGHADFALGSRLLMGNAYRKKGQVKEASVEYLEALSLADSQVVERDQADGLRQLYEPLIEAHSQNADEEKAAQLCDTVSEMLIRSRWRPHLRNMRNQLVPSQNGEPPSPIAQVLTEASSSQVVLAMSTVRELARDGQHQAAIEEALFALQDAPTYLPLHIVIGDLLISGNQMQGAIEKFTVVARSYSVRGETGRAIDMLRRVVDMAPMDLTARHELIDQLVARGQSEEAIKEYIRLAEVHYSLAELVEARKVYSRALRFAQQAGGASEWQTRILHRIADIDVQSLNWRQALTIYQQICTIQPDDFSATQSLVDLNFRLGERNQALATTHKFVEAMTKEGRTKEIIEFLKDLVDDWPEQAMIRSYLADQYYKEDKISEAVAQLDAAAEILLDASNQQGAIKMIQQIINLNPPDVEKYRQLLARIKLN